VNKAAVQSTDDWDLLNQSTKDPSALSELFNRHQNYVYRLAFSQLQHQQSAEEVTQEVFYRLAKTKKRFFKAAAFRTWLFKVVQNMIQDQRRKNKRYQNQVDDQQVAMRAAGQTESWTELSELSRHLAKLPGRQQQAVILRVLEGYSVAESAQAMGCSEGSVKTHLHRGLNAIRAMYELT